MLSLRTWRGPVTACLNTPVNTVFPRRTRPSACRCSPTARCPRHGLWAGFGRCATTANSFPHARRRLILREPDAPDFVHTEIAVWTVRDDCLAGDRLQLLTVDRDLHLIGFEGDHVADASHRFEGSSIRPGGFLRVADVVVGRQTLVRAEGLALDRVQSLRDHVGAGNIPARSET